VEVVGKSVEKSGCKEALRLAHTRTRASTSTKTTTTTTGMQKTGDNLKEPTGKAVDAAEVKNDLEETTEAGVGQLMGKSGRSSLQNEALRSAPTTTTTGMQKIGDPITGLTEKAVDAAEVAMELEETTTAAAV
jgi:hypothetical protein